MGTLILFHFLFFRGYSTGFFDGLIESFFYRVSFSNVLDLTKAYSMQTRIQSYILKLKNFKALAVPNFSKSMPSSVLSVSYVMSFRAKLKTRVIDGYFGHYDIGVIERR